MATTGSAVNAAPVSRWSWCGRRPSLRPMRSSPSMWATRTATPSLSAISRTRSAHPDGSSPPALETTWIRRSTHVPEHLLHLGHERRGEAAVGVAAACLPEDQHRQLGQPVAGQHVDRPAVDDLPGGGQPVAVEAGEVGDLTGRSFMLRPPVSRAPGVSTYWPTVDCTSRRFRRRGEGRVLHLHRLEDHELLAGVTSSPGGPQRTTAPGIGATREPPAKAVSGSGWRGTTVNVTCPSAAST